MRLSRSLGSVNSVCAGHDDCGFGMGIGIWEISIQFYKHVESKTNNIQSDQAKGSISDGMDHQPETDQTIE
jgi:hypothetical protein